MTFNNSDHLLSHRNQPPHTSSSCGYVMFMKGRCLGWVMDCTRLSCALPSDQQNLDWITEKYFRWLGNDGIPAVLIREPSKSEISGPIWRTIHQKSKHFALDWWQLSKSEAKMSWWFRGDSLQITPVFSWSPTKWVLCVSLQLNSWSDHLWSDVYLDGGINGEIFAAAAALEKPLTLLMAQKKTKTQVMANIPGN